MGREIDVRLLGPLEVDISGARVRFDGAKQRLQSGPVYRAMVA